MSQGLTFSWNVLLWKNYDSGKRTGSRTRSCCLKTTRSPQQTSATFQTTAVKSWFTSLDEHESHSCCTPAPSFPCWEGLTPFGGPAGLRTALGTRWEGRRRRGIPAAAPRPVRARPGPRPRCCCSRGTCPRPHARAMGQGETALENHKKNQTQPTP